MPVKFLFVVFLRTKKAINLLHLMSMMLGRMTLDNVALNALVFNDEHKFWVSTTYFTNVWQADFVAAFMIEPKDGIR
jgi:hypothetical protein